MTKVTDVLADPNYLPVLDKGFVGIVDIMGDDAAIVKAARLSYMSGTKSVRKDRGLIRYLMRHRHTSPFEMCDVKLHLKLPIFVFRQIVRHRTHSVNEESARYSILSDEMYIPEIEVIVPQSKVNNQGRGGELDIANAHLAQKLIIESGEAAYRTYKGLLGPQKDQEDEYAEFREEFGFSDDYPGIAREIARSVLPVNTYTELFWKQNLHNLFHLLKLRMDPHAQLEVREYAYAIYQLIKPRFPFSVEAFEDYVVNAKTVSRLDLNFLNAVKDYSNTNGVSFGDAFKAVIEEEGGEDAVLETYGFSRREFDELKDFWDK